ncbi:MAG: heparinase II/III family protein, partial [Kiloniellales bacterium]
MVRGLFQPAQLAWGGGRWAADLAALTHLPGPQALARLGYLVKLPLLALRFGGPFLARATVAQPLVSAPDPWPGDAERGAALIDGSFLLAGREIVDPTPLWAPPTADQEWLAELHAFSWLRDLRSVGGDKARRRARELLGSWLARHDRWRAPAWDPEVTGRRLAEWFGHYDFVAASAETSFREILLQSAERQGRYLRRVLPAGLAGGSLVAATKGLIYAAVCLPAGRPWLGRALDLLARELPRQMLGDGGQIERSPARQAALLRDLIDIRATLGAGGLETPPELAAAIGALGPVLRLLRHGDGGLALFNGSGEGEDWQLDLLLQRAGARGQPMMSAPAAGFQRLQAGRALILVDCGPPPPRGFDALAHAGTLSFEMSVGRERLIVNCGARYDDADWRVLQRSTAAHSTLTVADTNSSDVTLSGLG